MAVECVGVALVAVEGDAVFEEGIEPGGREVVAVEVGEEDAAEVGNVDACWGESFEDGAGSEARVDEQGCATGAQEGGVAG